MKEINHIVAGILATISEQGCHNYAPPQTCRTGTERTPNDIDVSKRWCLPCLAGAFLDAEGEDAVIEPADGPPAVRELNALLALPRKGDDLVALRSVLTVLGYDEDEAKFDGPPDTEPAPVDNEALPPIAPAPDDE